KTTRTSTRPASPPLRPFRTARRRATTRAGPVPETERRNMQVHTIAHAPHFTAHAHRTRTPPHARAHSRIDPLIVRSQVTAVACTRTISCAIILPSRPARSSEANSASAYALFAL